MNQSFMHSVIAIAMLIGSSVLVTSCKEEGCTDPDAINYDPEVTESVDASCEYPVMSLDIESVVNGEPFAFDQVF